MARTDVRAGASIPMGVAALKCFKKSNLGNFVLIDMPPAKEEALAVSRFCRENEIHFVFSEFTYRGLNKIYRPTRETIRRSEFLSKDDLEQIYSEGGEFYNGRFVLGEAGGMLYWPKEYLIGRKAKNYRNLPSAKDVKEAKEYFIQALKKTLKYEQRFGGKPLVVVDSSITYKYLLEAGVDEIFIEMMPGYPDLIFSAARGACRAYGKEGFGSHIAMGCYGGVWIDSTWMKRWKCSLYFSYLQGADTIFPESGHISYDQKNNQKFASNSPEMKETRAILRDFAFFSKIHKKPDTLPKTKIGFVHGNLDGFPGLWNTYVWGQFKGDEWLFQDSERGWSYLEGLYHKVDWSYPYLHGKEDNSGEVPGGMYDLVPAEANQEVINKYSCLIFLGWNTMTEELYEKLKAYVAGGGRLLMTVPHMNTSLKRDGKLKLFRKGDYRDLFGVKINGPGKRDVWGLKYIQKSSIPNYKFPVWRIFTDPRFLGEKTPAAAELHGAKVLAGFTAFYHSDREYSEKRPFLTENKIGEGRAFLINSWDWPGARGMESAVKEVLRVFMDGEKEKIRINGDSRIRYARYEKNRVDTFYVLNTDFNRNKRILITMEGKKPVYEPEVPCSNLRIFYFYGDLAIAAEDKLVNLEAASKKGAKFEFELSSWKAQNIEVFNFGSAKKEVLINGASVKCPSGEPISCKVRKDLKRFRNIAFNEDMHKERGIKWPEGSLPY